MQVSSAPSQSSSISLGAHKAVAMTVSESADFFHILSSSLYSDPILAVVREILCNAWDSHIASNNTEDMVSVTLTEDTMTIRDYGLGIPAEAFNVIYGTCGLSTKKEATGETGGFGLGCKAPFAYTDTFTVENCNNGVKYIYVMDKSSAENEGKPSISLLTSFPCNESGLKVIIPIQKKDFRTFNDTLQRIIKESGIPTKLNEKVQDVFQYPVNFEYVLDRRYCPNNKVVIKYGSVIYPIDLKKFKTSNVMYNFSRIIINAPDNSIDLVPSREALNYSRKTLKTVQKLLNKVAHNIESNLSKVIKSFSTKDIDKLTESVGSKDILTELVEIVFYSYGTRIFTDDPSAVSAYLPVPFKTRKAVYNAQTKEIIHFGPLVSEVSKPIYKIAAKLGAKIKLSFAPKSFRGNTNKRENFKETISYSLRYLNFKEIVELLSSPIKVGATLTEAKASTPGGLIFLAVKKQHQESLVNALVKAGFKVDWEKPEEVKNAPVVKTTVVRKVRDYVEAVPLNEASLRNYYSYINTTNIPISDLTGFKYVINASGKSLSSTLQDNIVSISLFEAMGDSGKILVVNTAKERDLCIRKGLKCISTYYLDILPGILCKHPNLLKELTLYRTFVNNRIQPVSSAVFEHVFKISHLTPSKLLEALYKHAYKVQSEAFTLGFEFKGLTKEDTLLLEKVEWSSLPHIYHFSRSWTQRFVEDLNNNPEAMNCFNYLLNTKG